MSVRRWALSAFFVWHVTAVTFGALASPGFIPPVSEATYAPGDALAAVVTPRLDRVAAALEGVPEAVVERAQPLPWLAAVYLSLTGVSQSWKMFASPPLGHQYVRVRYYIASTADAAEGAVAPAWTATELVLPAHREDEIRLFKGYRDAFRDKAMTSALNGFHTRFDRALIRPDTTSAELPNDLAPIARYFARRFKREALRPDEAIVRTEVWYGVAPITPPRVPPSRIKVDARLQRLHEYDQGPVEDPVRRPSRPVYHVGEREGGIEWVLEYVEPGTSPAPTSVSAPPDRRHQGAWQTAVARWEGFWFEEVPSEAYALVRIALGIGGLISLIGFLPIDMFWSPDGIAPLPVGGLGLRAYIAEAGLGVWVGSAIFAFLFGSFLCMTVGLFTGAAIVACFLGSVLQSRWNPLPLTSGHTVMVAALFCLVWADCGSSLSVDAWRRRRHGTADETPVQPIWPIRLIRIQIAVMYLASGFFKLLGTGWRSGVTVHYTTTHNIYGRIFHVYPLPDGLAWMLTGLTYATLFWEISFPFLMLHRATRTAAILAGVAIHLGIFATMEVGPFSWIVLATYLAYLDPHKTPGLVAWLSRFTPTRRAQAVAQTPSADSWPAA